MKTYLITGGAGFIGCNYAERLLRRGERVIVYDNLSRAGTRHHLNWLRSTVAQGQLECMIADVSDFEQLCTQAARADVIVHLAAQVAVTQSVCDPRQDFNVNALGTLNVLEAARRTSHGPVVIYASTNKVYGSLENIATQESDTRYLQSTHAQGINESQQLDFYSPYGCSKGAGDQYVRDYQRIYGLPTVVFRQSCIYGPHQLGAEAQGWVAWFMLAGLSGAPVTIYGDGKQVRDILHVDDLLNAYDLAVADIERIKGEVFNIGGGVSRSLSIWSEYRPILEELCAPLPAVRFKEWRHGDQKVYISDTRKLCSALDWQPTIDLRDGLRTLLQSLKTQGKTQV